MFSIPLSGLRPRASVLSVPARGVSGVAAGPSASSQWPAPPVSGRWPALWPLSRWRPLWHRASLLPVSRRRHQTNASGAGGQRGAGEGDTCESQDESPLRTCCRQHASAVHPRQHWHGDGEECCFCAKHAGPRKACWRAWTRGACSRLDCVQCSYFVFLYDFFLVFGVTSCIVNYIQNIFILYVFKARLDL